jgi:hypothetical protein
MRPEGDARVADTSGIEGVGKTKLVDHLREVIPKRHDTHDIQLFMEAASAPPSISESYTLFKRELLLLSGKLRAVSGRARRQFTEFDDSVAKIEKEFAYQFTHHTTVKDSTLVGSPVGNSEWTGGEALTADVRRNNAHAVIASFADAFNAMTEAKPALLTFDGFERFAAHELGDWLTTLFRSLRNTLVIVTRTPAMPGPRVPAPQALPCKLGLFTRDEVAELLSTYVPDETLDDELVDIVADWSRGHPFTAAIAGKLLRRTADRDAARLRRQLDALPAGEEDRDKLALAIVPDPLDAVVRAASVARRFDAGLLQELSGTPSTQTIDELRRLELIDAVGDPDSGNYQLHSYIRVPLEKSLEPDERCELHGRAASYYLDKISEDEEELPDGARGYDTWYRYEDPAWQANVREWLYHQREAAGDDKDEQRLARLRFTSVFLDAFWWWACYLDFPFCAALLEDWRQAYGDDDTEWLDDLETVLKAYPLGYKKQGRPGWEDVDAALRQLQLATELDVPVKRLTSDEERHVRGLIDNFLAHAARYREPERASERLYRQAVASYTEAMGLFEANDEQWELAWTSFELAELHVEHGKVDEARPLWKRAVELELAADDVDEELRANLHRLVADAGWDTDRLGALAAHGHAVLHAYAFQVRSKQRRPDAYTLAFYVEQMERAIERLLELGPGDALTAATRLQEPFAADDPISADELARLRTRTKADDLAAALFPPRPAPEELLETRSGFTRRWNAVCATLLEQLDSDLAAVEL